MQIQTFYQFVKQWKQREQRELAELRAGVKKQVQGRAPIYTDGYGNIVLSPPGGATTQQLQLQPGAT